MQTITGTSFVPGSATTARTIRGAKRHAFALMHHPSGGWALINLSDWDEVDGEGWAIVPKLSQFHHRPGVNGVRASKHGPQTSVAIVEKQQAGWQMIPYSAAPDGKSYVVESKDAQGSLYHDVWTTYEEGPRGHDIEFDSAEYLKWRLSLIPRGVIQPPTLRVVKELHRRIKVYVKRGDAGAEERQAALQARIDTLQPRRGRPRNKPSDIATAKPKRKRAPRKPKAPAVTDG
jgi:hypothetical protein